MKTFKCALLGASAVVLCTAAYAADEDRGHVNRPLPDLSDLPAAPSDALVDPMELDLDQFPGFTFRGKPIVDLNQVIQQIDSGEQNRATANTITYTFLEKNALTGLYNNPNFGFTAGNGVGPLSSEQRVQARRAVQMWDDLIAPKFVEKNGQGADIRFANSADPAQAYAYYPSYGFTNAQGWKFFGDIFLADPALNWTNNWFSPNGYGGTTIVHELGHSQGLSHPGAYNGAGATTYAGQAEYAQDSWQYSIMSYWAASETNGLIVNWPEFLNGYPQTPLKHDILTVQSKYGADPTTRTGNTVYGFNSNAGRDYFDFAANPYPNLAIYDAGGNDTIDVSGFTAPTFIDLHAGAFSSASQAVPTTAFINARRAALSALSGLTFAPITDASRNATAASFQNAAASRIAGDTGVAGIAATQYTNIAIAYGVTIENAIGGSARDLLWGNGVANRLVGNAGADVLDGFQGADIHVGGAGADVFSFRYLESGDVVDDFVTAEDRIDLRPTGVAFTFIGGAAFSNVAGQLRYSGGLLQGDANGDGVADITINLRGAPLAAGDLLL